MDPTARKGNIFADLPEIDREPRWKTTVSSNKEVAPDVVLLTLTRPEQFAFRAGQYVWLVLPDRTRHVGVVDRRAYSIASSNAGPALELLIRITASDYTQAVRALAVGAPVEIIGPMGSEFVAPTQGAVMIAGGVGVSPFLSTIRSRTGDFSVYVFEDPERPLYCREEVTALSKADGTFELHWVTGQAAPEHFAGLSERVGNRPVYVSGPQGFVDVVEGALTAQGVDRNALHFESCYPSSPYSVEALRIFAPINDVGEVERLTRSLLEQDQVSSDPSPGQGKWSADTLLWWFMVIVLVTTLVSGVALVEQEHVTPVLHFSVALSFVCLMLWRYLGGSTRAVSQGTVAVIFATLIYSRLDPALASMLEPWLLTYPVITRKLSSFRQALWWNVAFIGTFCTVTTLGNSGFFGIPPFEDSVFQFVIAIIFLSILTGIYSYREEQQDRAIEDGLHKRQLLFVQMNDALKLSEMFVKIASQTSNHVILTDHDGRVLYANHAAEVLTGYTFKEMRGQTPRLWGGLMTPQEYRRIWREKSHGLKVTHQITNRRRDGSLYVAIGHITPILQEAQVVAYVATEEDVTTFRDIDKTKSEFVSLASHQLRTPLSAIGWYAEMLLSGDAGKLTAKQKSYLQEIHTGNERMVDLVNALLNVSRLDLGTFVIEPQPTDIPALLKSVSDEQEPTIRERKIQVSVPSAVQMPQMSVDPKLLRMVFQNLLSNAIKYTPEGGHIAITLETKQAGEAFDTEELTEDSLCFSITDTGYGISKDQQGSVFTKLFRADNVKEKDTTGTGLGLYVVKSILDNSGGHIWFRSEEDNGSAFFVTLPLSGMRRREGSRPLG